MVKSQILQFQECISLLSIKIVYNALSATVGNKSRNQIKYKTLTLKESKNSRISAAVPMKTKRSCANWSRVKSPFGSIHRPIMRINIRACSISITNVSVSTGIVGIFPKSNGIWKKIMVENYQINTWVMQISDIQGELVKKKVSPNSFKIHL